MPEELQALKAEAERRIGQWATTGEGLASSSLYDAAAWIHTGVRDDERLDAQISIVVAIYPEPPFSECLAIDTDRFFDDKDKWLAPDTEGVMLLASPVLPKSEGQVKLESADPMSAPRIELNYFDEPDDVRTMVVALKRALDIADNWPAPTKLGPVMIPPSLADKHGHQPGDRPDDALLEDLALHYAVTVYHETSTCRLGDVVDARWKVMGAENLRVADASTMPTVVGGNTNAAAIMIGEKASEMIAQEHGISLGAFVGERSA
jgi:choline dehydrogenase-like flavoprotein